MSRIQEKKVLVTGADGFIGSHLVQSLLAQGADVRAMYFYNSFSSWGRLDMLPADQLEQIEVVPGDVRDSVGVARSMEGVDIVFHLAALIGIPYSYQCPDSYIQTNVNGTLNILEAARRNPNTRVLVTSTSEVYGTALYTPIDENHPLQAQSPYSASKIAADKLAESYWRSFDLPVTIVRPFNTFGPRQSARAVIPTIITQLLDGAQQIRLGSLSPRRDLNYVKDICEGFIALAQCPDSIGSEVNLARGEDISIGDLARMIIDQINPQAQIVCDSQRIRPEKSEVNRLLGSAQKAFELTGWKPKYTLREALAETIDWFRSNPSACAKAAMYHV